MTTTPLPSRCLALISDRRVCGGLERLERAVEAAVAGGVQLVQLREKDLAADDLLPLAQRLRRFTEGAALLFVNGDVNVALACGADGVHLAETSLSVAEAREIAAGQPLLIGRSVHDLTGALTALKERADLLQAGPVYATASHPGARPASLKLISDMSASVELPVLGVGGVTSEHVSEVLNAGAFGVAVIRAVLAAPSPYRASQQLRDALDHAPVESSSAIPTRAPGP